MHTFEFIRPSDPATAIATSAQSKTAQQGADVRFMGGGTTLLDLMKLNVETPNRVLDINRLPLDKIETMSDGGIRIGATVRNSDLAYHATVQRDYSVLSHAIWRLLLATCCSEHVVSTSAILRWRATSANPAPDARQSPATIARWQSWVRVTTASRLIRRTCA